MSKSKKQERVAVTVSSWTIIKILLILAGAFLVYTMFDFVVLILVSLLFAALMDPFAEQLSKRRIPRGVAVLIVYLGIFLIVGLAVVLVVPDMLREGSDLLVQYAPQLNNFFGTNINVIQLLDTQIVQQDVAAVVNTLQESGVATAIPEFLEVISKAFGSLLAVSLVLFLSFYMVVEEEALRRGLMTVTPKQHHPFLQSVLVKGRRKLGHWLRGQLLVMLAVGLICYAILSILGVPFALVLAVLAGLFEVILYIGPILASIPAIVIAFSVSPLTALLVAFCYFIVQQIEGNLLTPNIMKHVAGLNPVLSILALIVGFEIAGVLGAVVAIPFTMIILVFFKEWMKHRKD